MHPVISQFRIIRFKDKFEFQIEADPALLKYLCPKLSIQAAA